MSTGISTGGGLGLSRGLHGHLLLLRRRLPPRRRRHAVLLWRHPVRLLLRRISHVTLLRRTHVTTVPVLLRLHVLRLHVLRLHVLLLLLHSARSGALVKLQVFDIVASECDVIVHLDARRNLNTVRSSTFRTERSHCARDTKHHAHTVSLCPRPRDLAPRSRSRVFVNPLVLFLLALRRVNARDAPSLSVSVLSTGSMLSKIPS